jgi:hypothetical protein
LRASSYARKRSGQDCVQDEGIIEGEDELVFVDACHTRLTPALVVRNNVLRSAQDAVLDGQTWTSLHIEEREKGFIASIKRHLRQAASFFL